MVQPSYPHTIELPHSSPSSTGTPKDTGADQASTDMAPPEGTSPAAHANDSNQNQAEREGSEPVNEGSIVRKEKGSGPGGPHHA